MPRCRSCSPRPNSSPCRFQRPGSSCAAPTPRETNNYYSRNHERSIVDTCKGSCYCPDNCSCPHKGLGGRFACPRSCDPCAKIDCPMRCCPPKKCCPPPRCCSPRSSQQKKCCPPPKCNPCCDPCCDPCCMGPYCPPARKPICYPPIKSCEPNPCERICYYPCPPPCQPKYCTCGSANPCDCDLNVKRKQLECERAPCCRRCGRKVYHAEKIMASGGAFHTCCFSCYCCHKPLEVTSVYENQGRSAANTAMGSTSELPDTDMG
ncbi:hypothetical protein MML48_9g00001964 [Holotrichia oblita]|uniref:Uncharacterized protein n=1 Tax=Holotrichia oblita TaxID=644536 RepID=A0ACB9SI07_HOLOL|nr:hypothetical protein MML48_9g00001964 [Holotrichia oblita]